MRLDEGTSRLRHFADGTSDSMLWTRTKGRGGGWFCKVGYLPHYQSSKSQPYTLSSQDYIRPKIYLKYLAGLPLKKTREVRESEAPSSGVVSRFS